MRIHMVILGTSTKYLKKQASTTAVQRDKSTCYILTIVKFYVEETRASSVQTYSHIPRVVYVAVMRVLILFIRTLIVHKNKLK